MGSNIAKHTHNGIIYYPNSKYIKFPQRADRNIGTIVKSFHVLPPGASVGTQPGNFYWWAQVEFVLFEDDHLYVSFGGYLERAGLSSLAVTHIYQGRIFSWSLTPESCSSTNVKGTHSSTLPNLSVHPGGACVVYAGKGNLVLQNPYNGFQASMSKAMRGNSFKKGVVSPNGYFIAVIAKRSHTIELILSRLEGNTLLELKFINCHKICPGFHGDNYYMDLYECTFSMDSSLIAIGSSYGELFVVDIDLNPRSIICPGMIDKAVDRMANERSFDFDTRYLNSKIAVGSEGNVVYICDLETDTVSIKRQVQDEDSIQCVKYSRSGHCLAVASSIGDIFILHSDTLECQYILSAATLNKTIALCTVNGSLAHTLYMSFDTSGEHLAVSYTDGLVRIWQLAPLLNLQHLCKMIILQYVHLKDLNQLPLPGKVIQEIYPVAPLS